METNHKWMKATSIVALIATMQMVYLTTFPDQLQAASDQGTDANAVDATKLAAPAVDCDTFCAQFVQKTNQNNGSKNGFRWSSDAGAAASLDQSGPWSTTDDQWCAAHGSVTDVSAGPGPSPTPITSATCNVPTIPADGPATAQTCSAVNKKLLHCKFHNSIVESQCLAYEAAGGAWTFDTVLVVLDLAVAATCAFACLLSWSPAVPALEMACEVSGIVASASELIDTIIQNDGPVGTTISSVAVAVGLGSSIAGMALTQTGASAVTDEAGKTTQEGTGTAGTAKQKAACVAAITFAVMAGVRIADIVSMSNTKSDACKAVQSGISSAAVVNPGAAATDTNYSNYTPGNGTGGGAGTGPAGTGGSTGSVTGSSASAIPTIPPNGLTNSGTTSAATDAGMLTNSGMDKSLTPLANHLLDNGLGNAIRQGAGAAMQAAMGGVGAPADIADGFGKLAQSAQDHPGDVGGSGLYSGGGGGGGGSKGGDGASPFASLFGGGAKDGGSRGPSSEQFGKASVSDIWHTGTTQNLFEIVSGKIEKVAARVMSR